MANTPHALATLCAHAGAPRCTDIGAGAHSHVSPLYQHSVFDFPSVEASKPALDGDGYVYRRNGTPNVAELAQAVAQLEGAEAGVATNSGMSAIATAVLATCSAGSKVVVQSDAYGGTGAFLQQDLTRFGITVVTADAYDHRAFTRAVEGANLALVETVSNPLLREADIASLARLCREAGATLMVDNTFATPLRQRPLASGAHVVVHSVTKFLGGHHDLCAGAVVGDAETMALVQGVATRMGFGCAPLDAWLAVRGIRTLEVRMTRAWETAAFVAQVVRDTLGAAHVRACDRCALVSLDVGTAEAANRFVSGLRMLTLSPSLGGVTTTVSHPATSSHKGMTPQAREAVGIGDGLVRVSVGVESRDDIVADIRRGLNGL